MTSVSSQNFSWHIGFKCILF